MKSWIQGAIKKPGALHEELGVAQGTKIPEATLEQAAGEKGKLGQRARFALNMKGLNKPSATPASPWPKMGAKK